MNETRFFLRDPDDGSLHRPIENPEWGYAEQTYYLPACRAAGESWEALELTANQYQDHSWKYGTCSDCYTQYFDIEPAKPMRWSFDPQRVGWWDKVRPEEDMEAT